MSTKLGRGFEIKDGKVVKKPVYRSVSQRLKAKKANHNRVRVQRRGDTR